MAPRTQRRFLEEVPALLAEHGISARELARRVGVDQSYLAFVIGGRRSPSRRLLEGAAAALGLPPDYFREYREAIVLERIKADPALLDRIYALVTKPK
jgi:transcriptional regulator with XRE-family HTH domain